MWDSAPGHTHLHAADEAGADVLLQPHRWGVSPEDLHNLEKTMGTMSRDGLGTSLCPTPVPEHPWGAPGEDEAASPSPPYLLG